MFLMGCPEGKINMAAVSAKRSMLICNARNEMQNELGFKRPRLQLGVHRHVRCVGI